MRKIILVFLLFCISMSSTFAQNKYIRKAKKHEIKGEYLKATISYQLYLDSHDNDISIYKKLADLSCKLNDFDSAEMYCEEIINKNLADPETYFLYINILRRNGKYDKSIDVFKEFSSTFPNEIFKYYRTNKLSSRKKFYSNYNKIRISDFKFNSINSEFSPFINNNEIYYTSYDNGNNREEPDTKVEKFINKYITPFNPNYKICKAVADTFSMKYESVKFKKLLGSNYHEGIASISISGKVMYFSAARKGEKTTFGHSITGFDIYEARLINNRWKITQKLFHVPGKSFAHPCINKLNNMIYFCSDMDGGYGGTDLYVSYLTGGTWSEPENLGPQVNTPGNELYPFVDERNTLYFASDGHPGLGGLDIFVVVFEDKKVLVFNVGAPINSRFDDYSLCAKNNNTSGFFTSNRPGGMGEHDIYSFISKEPLNLLAKSSANSSFVGFMTLKGEVRDIFSNRLINNAEVVLRDEQGNYSDYKSTATNGKFTFIVPVDGEYIFMASGKGYKTMSSTYLNGQSFYTLKAEPEFTFPNILFDFNSSHITEEGKETLNSIVNCMFEYPKTKIYLKAYSDIVGEGDDNKTLSQERALAIEKFLENKGIKKDRISSKSLGTKDPIITLENEDAFDKEDAQSVNRRVEISIIHPTKDSIKN